ncbi:hypothetical protein [Methyloversatilis sp.]|uniref:hypothetical protein n=1 Tax=Methyloversatilis sp. TaxID=2569862 RepID=UPI0035AE49F5
MSITFKIIDRQKTLIVLENDSPNFVASAQFFVIGDKAFAHSINGTKFYKCVRQYLREIFAELGVRYIEAYVLAGHFRLIKMMLGSQADVEQTGSGQMSSHEMIWVRIAPKQVER